MELRSLTWRTDLAILAHDGSAIVDRGDCVVVRTPDNPDFYWGNCLVLPGPPAAAALPGWIARFDAEVGGPGIAHVALGWDDVDGEVPDEAALRAAGFAVDWTIALATAAPAAGPTLPPGVAVRALAGDADWAALEALSIAVYPDDGAFAARRRRAQSRAVEAGHGAWWGAFDPAGALVASAACFDVGDLARYHDVQTAPAWRRRGLAGALIVGLAREALARGAREVVIVADEGYEPAVRLYTSLGFTARERVAHACRAPSA